MNPTPPGGPEIGVEIFFLSLLALYLLWHLPLVRVGIGISWQGKEGKVEIRPSWVSRLIRSRTLLPPRRPERGRRPVPPGIGLLLSLLRQQIQVDCQGWMKVGTGEAATTALLAGALLSLFPRLQVVPDFLGRSWAGEVRCIFRLTPGQIIRQGWQIWTIRSRD